MLALIIIVKEGKANTLLADHLFSPALYLAERIERVLLPVAGRRVIELGAGCALPSLLMTALSEPPSLVVITDFPDDTIMSNLKNNVERNRDLATLGCKVHCLGYEWGKDAGDLLQLCPDPSVGFDTMILSDLLHFNDSHEVLVESIKLFLSNDSDARAYISAGKYTVDSVCQKFIRIAQDAGLSIEEEHDEQEWQGDMEVRGMDKHGLTLRKRNCRFWVTKSLSEFSGQTIAVDAYVWLHKGAYACATELATGKPTHKYVDYAMHRVRLLRHYKIEPYVVFDGGPLPAKQNTEHDRKRRRDEHLARGNALAAQGKHSQARECYVKSIDVTPQMAYQFIKALRAENVSYVVAPYEADAQLAYLERRGLVDGILTEDSDLLVYGCRTVLFKLDPIAATVVSVSRKDFGNVTFPSSEISLVGWSDVQFRAMAILSGCDYLPSITGIGLKTACSLLRKWKTVEQAIRNLVLEKRKPVPKDYLNNFRKAEKCFLHQRVYCPLAEQLVHLTDVDRLDWNDEYDAYVGGYIEPELAKTLAHGNTDPINLLPMHDINPSYKPAASKAACMHVRSRQFSNNKGKPGQTSVASPKTGGILNFFGHNTGPARSYSPSGHFKHIGPCLPSRSISQGTGKASGKRTLTEVMEQEVASHHQKKHELSLGPRPSSQNRCLTGVLTESKFFASYTNMNDASKPTSSHARRRSHFLRPSATTEKENIYIADSIFERSALADEEGVPKVHEEDVPSEVSHRADDGGEQVDLDIGHEENVQQEDGYISPLEIDGDEFELSDFSSPVRPVKRTKTSPHKKGSALRRSPPRGQDDDDFDVEAISSPPRSGPTLTFENVFRRWEYCADHERGQRTARGKFTGVGMERRHSFPLPSLHRTASTALSHAEETELGEGTSGPSHVVQRSDELDAGKPDGGLYKVFVGPDIFLEGTTEEDLTIQESNHDGIDIGKHDDINTTTPSPSASPNTPEEEEDRIIRIVIDDDDDIPNDEPGVNVAFPRITKDRNNDVRKKAVDGWGMSWKRNNNRQPVHSASQRASGTIGRASLVPAATATRGRSMKQQQSSSSLRRSETNVTPRGRHSLTGACPRSRFAQLRGARAAAGATNSSINLTLEDDTARRHFRKETINEPQLKLDYFW
ncbi:hypothetical protein AX17_003162 [Amanita inopinata Kibby_2008]|nr:hypothetical protein AX17_003162 [Amanita inopinata Kibby_2008]